MRERAREGPIERERDHLRKRERVDQFRERERERERKKSEGILTSSISSQRQEARNFFFRRMKIKTENQTLKGDTF